MTTFEAQNWIDTNLNKNVEGIFLTSTETELTGELKLENYPNLKEIVLRDNKLASLTIINCPNLKHINLKNNSLNKLEVQGNNQLKELIASQNNLTSLDLTDCQKVYELLISDNPNLKELKNLNQTNLKNFNIVNTQIDLNKEEKELIKKNDTLFGIVKGVNEMGQQHELVIVEPVMSPQQNKEAIHRLLTRTRKSWLEYLESTDPNIGKKKPLLHLSFQYPKLRNKAQEILVYISGALVGNYDYEALLKEWNGTDENYNPTYDFDLALFAFINHVRVQQPLMVSWEQQPKPNPIFYDF